MASNAVETVTLDSAHVYRDEAGRVVPGVTSVLKAVGMIDASWYTPECAMRGTSVHTLTALHDDGLIDENTPVAPEYVNYLNAWIRFRCETGFQPVHIEHRVFHAVHRYAGTLDRDGLINDRWAVLDIKTGKASPATGVQLAAYAGCMPPAYARFAVELHDDGTYRLIEYRDRQDWNTWLAALEIFCWRTHHHVNT